MHKFYSLLAVILVGCNPLTFQEDLPIPEVAAAVIPVVAPIVVPVAKPVEPVVVKPAVPAKPLPKLPAQAPALIPSLHEAIDKEWPTMKPRSIFAAQIEQESCISITHSKCWNPRAELKTSREYGFGLGQITIAYNANGSERFNNFTGTKKQYPQLKGWAWEDRYNATNQMRTLVLMNKDAYTKVRWDTASEMDRYAFMLSAYNGGFGGVTQDRTICVNTKGCDPSKWFGNVEKHSFKAKTKLHGYGKSFFEINREYVVNVLDVRRPKYIPYMD